jgi:hypothetical protein
MLGNLALYMANRATAGAVGSWSRWASWIAVAALFLSSAFALGLCALFWTLSPHFGAIAAAAIIAGGLGALGLACLAAPNLLELLERRAAARAASETGPVVTTVQSVEREAGAAVDYFGPLQVVASAFLVGMSTARTVRSSVYGRQKA